MSAVQSVICTSRTEDSLKLSQSDPLGVRCRLTRSAAADLRQIFRYGEGAFCQDQAAAHPAHFAPTFETVAAHPRIAREHTEITPPVRIHASGAHLIGYRIDAETGSLSLRVRHGREEWLTDPLG